jgi:hypothetical protein
MNPLLVSTLLALAATPALDEKQAAAPKLDGKWTVVYAEEGGRRNTAWETRPATFKDDTLSYEDAGKQIHLKLKFGPHQTVSATGLGKEQDKSGKGVYIAGQDYLSLSLNPEGSSREAGGSSGDFILILRRQRAK